MYLHPGFATCIECLPMAGYSETPLAKKLGIKEGSRVAVVGERNGFAGMLGALPPGARFVAPDDVALDVVVCFVTEAQEVEERFLEMKPRLAWTGGLWMGWPKRGSGIASTVSENTIRELGLAAGLVDNKVCAIDEQWSGLRFVWRLADRPKKTKTGRGAA